MRLTSQKVNYIFLDCLFKKEENFKNQIKAEGVTNVTIFNSERLENHKKEIEELLDELPEQFKKSGGGGWSFVQAYKDKHGNQWTDLHQRMEQLFQLGIAIGKVECQFPRKMWSVLCGGMPYYIINK